MEAEKKPEILHSEPVREIMGRPPGKILKFGTTLIFSVLLLILILAWLIKYPDIIRSQVEITTENPPVTMSAKVSGRIKNLYVVDGEAVPQGKLLAVIETAASIGDIDHLKKLTDTVTRPELFQSNLIEGFPELGELQSHWALFQKNLSDYQAFVRNNYYGNKIIATNEEIKSLRQYVNRVEIKEKIFVENLAIESKKFRRDSILYVQKVFSESEIESSRQSLLRYNIDLQNIRLDHASRLIEIASKNLLLQEYRIMGQAEKEKLLSALNESFLNLKAQIRIWEINYLLISPIGGVVSFTSFWHNNQTVTRDEPVLNVIPVETGDYIGRVNLKMQRSGKVKPGLMVNIKLSGYPYLEYGMLRGSVKSISDVPVDDGYVIEISLSNGFRTLYGREVQFTQKMQGIAEIITEDTRLLQKIINPFRHLASVNKRTEK